MKVLITGARGFIGKNLELHLIERDDIEVLQFDQGDAVEILHELVSQADLIFHLAAANRPKNADDFQSTNVGLTKDICNFVAEVARLCDKKIPIIYTSSIQAVANNAYGKSKLAAENLIRSVASNHGVPTHIFRLPNVFGKWCKPNYNSAVATFCYNISRGLPISVTNPLSAITLVYIDDVIECFLKIIDGELVARDDEDFSLVLPQYETTVGNLVEQLKSFAEIRRNLTVGDVGNGLTRALYSTYVSYLPPDSFSYAIPQYSDSRGMFVEMLRTTHSGQFSFFTARPGITRGGHYHHSKTEKFLVVKGDAVFRFKHMLTAEEYEIAATGDISKIVETVPGWTHDITNVGTDEMIVMLWASELFDRAKPDTFACPI